MIWLLYFVCLKSQKEYLVVAYKLSMKVTKQTAAKYLYHLDIVNKKLTSLDLTDLKQAGDCVRRLLGEDPVGLEETLQLWLQDGTGRPSACRFICLSWSLFSFR